jgi:GDP-L-fucose synthase
LNSNRAAAQWCFISLTVCSVLQPQDSIYIAGHTGLIGSAFMRELTQAGYGALITRTHSELELTDKTAVDAFFDATRPRYVIIAAGRVGGIMQNQATPASFLTENLAIQLNVLQAARRVGVERLVLFGSSCMYPRECSQPMAETALLTGHPEPTSLSYAIAKLAGVQLCRAYNQQYGDRRFIAVIPNSAYGPNDDFNPQTGHVLSALIARFHGAVRDGAPEVTLWGTGTPRREFIHAGDVADAAICLLRLPELTLDAPINIGSGIDYSIRELAEAIAQIAGFQGRLVWDNSRPDGAPRKLLDSTRLRSIGWTPRVALEDGLRETFDWYMRHIA